LGLSEKSAGSTRGRQQKAALGRPDIFADRGEREE